MLVSGNDFHGLDVAIVGATGVLGKDLIEGLIDSEVAVHNIRLFASASSVGETMDVGGRQKRVHSLPENVIETPLFEGVDVVIFACPGSITRETAPKLSEEEIAVVDVGGSLGW